MSAEGRGVQSMEVGWRVLEAMIAGQTPMMLRNIAKAAGIAPAQAHPYLVSYRKSQLVVQDQSTGLYRIGPLAIELGLSRLRSFDPFQAVNDGAQDLASETGLTVVVVVWGAYGPTVVQIREGADQILMKTRPGTVYSLTGTATGRVFAAYLPRDLLNSAMKTQQAEGQKARLVGDLPSLNKVKDEIEFVREKGYSPIESSPIPGINAVSAPIFDMNGHLIMAATLMGSSNVLNVSEKGPGVQKLVSLADSISARAGFTRSSAPAEG